jgi:hypothetical protein
MNVEPSIRLLLDSRRRKHDNRGLEKADQEMAFPSCFVALTIAALSTLVHAVAYDGPVATPVLQRFAANGWTPKPTTEARPLLELFRRQDDPGLCGYLEGDSGMFVFLISPQSTSRRGTQSSIVKG